MENNLIKIRSYSNCLKTAFETYITNIKKILKSIYKPLIVLGIIVLVYNLYYSNFNPQKWIEFNPTDIIFLGSSVIIYNIIFMVLMCIIFAKVITIINDFSFKTNLKRTVIALIFTVIYGLLFLIPSISGAVALYLNRPQAVNPDQPYHNILMIIIPIIVMIIAYILFLPFTYVLTKYIIEPQSSLLKGIIRKYVIGMKSLGFIFATNVLGLIILFTIGCFIYQPVGLLYFLNVEYIKSVMMGDNPTLPMTYNLIFALTQVLVSVIGILGSIWVLLYNCYVYGTIEKKILDKKDTSVLVETQESHHN